jgi:hypothetical protein
MKKCLWSFRLRWREEQYLFPGYSRGAVSRRFGESGLGRHYAASSRSRAEYRVRLTINLRRAAPGGAVCGVRRVALPPFKNRRAVPPDALGTPGKTAHVDGAARTKSTKQAIAATLASRPLCYNTGSLAVA